MKALLAILAVFPVLALAQPSGPALPIPFASQKPIQEWGRMPLTVGVDFNGGPWGKPGYTTWLTIDATVARDGGGSFIQFFSPDRNGKREVAVTINAGLIDATPGRISGDYEVNIPVEGVTVVNAITGPWNGQPAGFLTWPAGVMSIGGPNNFWKTLWLPTVRCPSSVPNYQKLNCVPINGGFVPIYQ